MGQKPQTPEENQATVVDYQTEQEPTEQKTEIFDAQKLHAFSKQKNEAAPNSKNNHTELVEFDTPSSPQIPVVKPPALTKTQTLPSTPSANSASGTFPSLQTGAIPQKISVQDTSRTDKSMGAASFSKEASASSLSSSQLPKRTAASLPTDMGSLIHPQTMYEKLSDSKRKSKFLKAWQIHPFLSPSIILSLVVVLFGYSFSDRIITAKVNKNLPKFEEIYTQLSRNEIEPLKEAYASIQSDQTLMTHPLGQLALAVIYSRLYFEYSWGSVYKEKTVAILQQLAQTNSTKNLEILGALVRIENDNQKIKDLFKELEDLPIREDEEAKRWYFLGILAEKSNDVSNALNYYYAGLLKDPGNIPIIDRLLKLSEMYNISEWSQKLLAFKSILIKNVTLYRLTEFWNSLRQIPEPKTQLQKLSEWRVSQNQLPGLTEGRYYILFGLLELEQNNALSAKTAFQKAEKLLVDYPSALEDLLWVWALSDQIHLGIELFEKLKSPLTDYKKITPFFFQYMSHWHKASLTTVKPLTDISREKRERVAVYLPWAKVKITNGWDHFLEFSLHPSLHLWKNDPDNKDDEETFINLEQKLNEVQIQQAILSLGLVQKNIPLIQESIQYSYDPSQPISSDMSAQKAYASIQLKDFEKAKELLNQILEGKGDTTIAKYLMAKMHVEKSNSAEALVWLQEFENDKTVSPNATILKGNIWDQMVRPDMALSAWQEAYSLMPQNYTLLRKIVLTALEYGKTDGIDQLITLWAKFNGAIPQEMTPIDEYIIGKSYLLNEQEDKALSHLLNAIKDEKMSEAHFLIGKIYARKHKYDDAVLHLQNYLKF